LKGTPEIVIVTQMELFPLPGDFSDHVAPWDCANKEDNLIQAP
jgi:hypothetical protein